MDIDKELSTFVSKQSIVNFILQLPDDAIGLMMFKYDDPNRTHNEKGDELEMNSFKFYGSTTMCEILWMLENFKDYIRS